MADQTMCWIDDAGVMVTDCVVFFRVNEPFGALSNMCGGFPLQVCGVPILSSEALYQACRFPDHPEIQDDIIAQPIAIAAKMKAQEDHRHERLTRADWNEVRVDVMRWCLKLKLLQNFGAFFDALIAANQRPIVEQSRHDRFWGAIPEANGTLRGNNQLGRLLMELRDEIRGLLTAAKGGAPFPTVLPPAIENFRLLGREIGPIDVNRVEERPQKGSSSIPSQQK